MSGWIEHATLGVQAAFSLGDAGVPVAALMMAGGLITGIVVGATPGLAGPMAMAIALPILLGAFGYAESALLPVLGFLLGIMKGATLGGAVPAILFNTPGTPDAYLTTLDGHPMARRGEAGRALRLAHTSSAAGDTFSDVVLILTAPFLAVAVEQLLGLPEKTALLLLSLAFVAAVVGGSPGRGLIAVGLGLLLATIGTGQGFDPRLTFGVPPLAQGLPVATVVLGVLIVDEILTALERYARDGIPKPVASGGTGGRLAKGDLRAAAPAIGRGALIGTGIGALPGVGSTLAATLSYAAARRRPSTTGRDFGDGAPEGIAATEAANSSVSGANLIPVLSLGVPGNAAAIFIILAADSLGGFNPGPSVFRIPAEGINPELVVAFALFTLMMLGNVLNWTVGGVFMRLCGGLARLRPTRLLPAILLVTLAGVYAQAPDMATVWLLGLFGVLGWGMRKLGISPLPLVIAFLLGPRIEETARQAFSATGSDPFFLFSSWTAGLMTVGAVLVVILLSRGKSS
jgi:putative tricarboxylic transport membrane protein